jgi:hypothetical protein
MAKIDIKEVGCGDVDKIQLAQNIDGQQVSVTTAMNFRVNKSWRNLGTRVRLCVRVSE